jgi:hypothetical protein
MHGIDAIKTQSPFFFKLSVKMDDLYVGALSWRFFILPVPVAGRVVSECLSL